MKRQSSIELLRIVAIIGVIIMHYCNGEIGGGMTYVDKGSVNEYIMRFIIVLFAFAVDLFFMISGYFMTYSYQRKIRKPLSLIIHVMLVKLVVYLAINFSAGTPIYIKSMIASMIPANYFVIMYIVVFFLSPYINIVLDTLKNKEYKTFFIIVILIFSIWSTGVNLLNNMRGEAFEGLDTVGNWGNQSGYTIVNFIIMYIIGATIRRYNVNEKIRTGTLCLAFSICLIANYLMMLVEARMTPVISSVSMAYCSPFVIAEAAAVFMVFLNIKIGSINIINKLSPGVFTAFLVHFYLLKFIGIDKMVNASSGIMILHIVFSSTAIFLICVILHYIYNMITKPIFDLVFKKGDYTVIDIKK